MNEQNHFLTNCLINLWDEIIEYLLQHPDQLIANQLSFYQANLNLYYELSHADSEKINTFLDSDKRFKHEEWKKNLLFNFIQRSYQLLAKQLENSFTNPEIKNKKLNKKMRFYSKQMLDAIAPSNFIHLNPEVLAKMLETNGASLMAGLKQFQIDLMQGNGQLKIQLTDTESFILGKNIACTPGKVVYQNDLMQLIQYTAATEKTYTYPLLIIPPWVNKYYILDLQKENSLVKWLVDQGYTVFMISWVNADSTHRKKEFGDYLLEGPLAALKVMQQITKSTKANVLGYCIGGTLLGCLLAYLAEKPNSIEIVSATFLTTLFDFSHPGDIGVFVDEKQINALEKQMQKKGYLDGNVMAFIFNILRANDLIWSAFVNQYLKGEKPKPFDLLYWNDDSTNIPELTHLFYLRNMYLENTLIQPGKIKLDDVPLDLSKITTPTYFLAAQEDHIIPWKSCYQGLKILNQASRFVLTGSGHVAGVINPPYKKKYGYWTNNTLPLSADDFFTSATFHVGSWWCDWQRWLKKYSGKSAKHSYEPMEGIEEAPGSYVKIRLSDIADRPTHPTSKNEERKL